MSSGDPGTGVKTLDTRTLGWTLAHYTLTGVRTPPKDTPTPESGVMGPLLSCHRLGPRQDRETANTGAVERPGRTRPSDGAPDSPRRLHSPQVLVPAPLVRLPRREHLECKVLGPHDPRTDGPDTTGTATERTHPTPTCMDKGPRTLGPDVGTRATDHGPRADGRTRGRRPVPVLTSVVAGGPSGGAAAGLW